MKYLEYFESIDFDNDIINNENIDWENEFDWEEEDPYIDRNIKVGDKIRVTDELNYYIKKYNWPRQMYNLIGKVYIVLKKGTNRGKPCFYIDGWSIPEDCVEKVA
jgi:hypothetical protein